MAVVASARDPSAPRTCAAAPLTPRVPVGRNPRVLPPRLSARPGRPHSTRSFTASLFVSQSAAARALVDGASFDALWSPPVRSELPAFHLGVRQGCARSMQEAVRVATAWAAAASATARAARVASARVAWRDDRAGRTGSGRENFSKRDAVEERDERGRAGGGQRRRGGTRGSHPRRTRAGGEAAEDWSAALVERRTALEFLSSQVCVGHTVTRSLIALVSR